MIKCAICGKETSISTIRESWILAGGFGTIPPGALVHPACDVKEQRKLKAGKIELSDLWTRTTDREDKPK